MARRSKERDTMIELVEIDGMHYTMRGDSLLPLGKGLANDYAVWRSVDDFFDAPDGARDITPDEYDNSQTWAEVRRRSMEPGVEDPRALVDVRSVDLTPELIDYLRS